MNPTPASPSNRDLLWLIFGALMLIAGVQLIPIRGEARQWLGEIVALTDRAAAMAVSPSPASSS